MKQIIKCYAAAYADDGRISYYFNRMPDNVDVITDIAVFSKDKSISSILSYEQKDKLESILCSFIMQDNPYLKENKQRGTCYRVGPYGYYIIFNLIVDIKIQL